MIDSKSNLHSRTTNELIACKFSCDSSEIAILKKLEGKNFVVTILGWQGPLTMKYTHASMLPYYPYNGATKCPLPTILVKQLFQAISHCHKNNIIHGNVNPYNILVNQKEIALSGFSSAIDCSKLETKPKHNTLGYNSPVCSYLKISILMS